MWQNMADDPPRLTIVAEQSEAERDKQRALDELRWPTREMTANLLRVMRGAGRPHYLPQQIIDLAGMILEANKLSNAWGIWTTMEEVLHDAFPDRDDDIDSARQTLLRGSLQTLASNLVDQNTQRIRGERELTEGVDEMLAAWNERRRLREEENARRASAYAALTSPKPRQRKKVVKRAPVAPRMVAAPPAPKPEPKVHEEKPVSTAEFMKRRRKELSRPE